MFGWSINLKNGMPNSLPRLGKFLAILSLNMFPTPLSLSSPVWTLVAQDELP